MKICIVVEGSYPYVQGGVSSWVNSLISQMPEFEFVVQSIVTSREESGKFKYDLPGNVTAVNESFLQDYDYVSKRNKRKGLTKEEHKAIKSLLFAENEQWEVVFDMFKNKKISVNDILMGKGFYDIVWEYYNYKYSHIVFTEFLWTCRSMYLPIFTILKSNFVEADIYHTMSTGYAGLIASCAGYIYKKPVLLTEHGIYTREREEEIIRANWTRGIYKDLWINHFYMMSHCIYRRADRVFTIFAHARELQVELGCPREKTEVIHNGVNIDMLQNIPVKDKEDPYINVGAIVRVTPIKDIKTMINAFHYAKEKVPRLKLFIIGNTQEDIEYYNECLELIKMLGTLDVVFTGHVNVRDYIGKMDMVLLTSISEGQPLSILEAMAARKPCITTNVGDCYDMLNAKDADNCAGFVVSVMNVGQISRSIVRLSEDENLRNKMGENGYHIVDKFYRDTVFIHRYRNVYHEFM